jgi:protein-S-isoprenylcysteine O-methyltransferase Ste14
MPQAEAVMRWIGAAVGLGTLTTALVAMALSFRRSRGRTEGRAGSILRLPFLIAATIAFLAAGAWLWMPIPVRLGDPARWALAVLGELLLVGGCLLYLWGLRALGAMFSPSSGFGVALFAGHQLITAGPYAFVRHPMYLGVMLAAWGSLLLYRTWAVLGFSIVMFGLAIRARREERVLGDEFGQAWRAYAARVPAWFPRRKTGSQPPSDRDPDGRMN